MITLTSPSLYQYGYVEVTEGDLVSIYITRDDASVAQDFDIQWRNISGDQSGEFSGVNIYQPFHVHWDAGDVDTRIIQFQTADDSIAEGSTLRAVNFNLIPGAGTAAGQFDAFGSVQDYLQVFIQEDDVPNVSVSLSGGSNGTMARLVPEGESLTMTFTRTDVSQDMTFEMRPQDGYLPDAARWWGYDPAHPLVVHLAAGGATTQTLTVTATEDHVTDAAGPTGWLLVPTQNVSGFAGPDPEAKNIIHRNDGSLAILIEHMNDDTQNTVPVSRFYDLTTNTHFYTADTYETSVVQRTLPNMRYEGEGFQTMTSDAAGAAPVWRFYDDVSRTHFYTSSDAERDQIMATLKSYHFEGNGFFASGSDGADLTEVYRFYNPTTMAHFYTVNVGERDSVIANLPDYHYEGIAFYVPADDTVVA